MRPEPHTETTDSPLGLDWQIAGFGAVIGGVTGAMGALFGHAAGTGVVAGIGAGALLGGILGFLLARPLKRDLREISLYAAVLARGQLDAHLPGDGTGELRYLMQQLRTMARSLKEQVEALRRLADERTSLAARTERLAVLEERQRLARELHDTVSQELFSVAMLVGAMRQTLPEGLQALHHQLALAEEGARRAQATMRGLIHALRPLELGDRNLVGAITAVLNEVQERQAIATEFKARDMKDLPPSVEDALFRIAQEALSNAVRHGQPSRIAVEIAHQDAVLVMTVRDNGAGFDAATAVPHVGLLSMRERAADIGAVLHVSSHPGSGTQVEVRIRDVLGDQREDSDGD